MEERELIQLVLDFAQEINNLQLHYAALLHREDTDSADVFQRYHKRADQVYGRYLTRRKRSCFYNGLGDSPFFCGVNTIANFTVERTEKRAVVTVCTSEGLLDFQFNLTVQKGEWSINSFKQRYRSQDRLTAYGWQYGNF